MTGRVVGQHGLATYPSPPTLTYTGRAMTLVSSGTNVGTLPPPQTPDQSRSLLGLFCSFHFLSWLCHTQPPVYGGGGGDYLEAGVPPQQEEAQDRKPSLQAINHLHSLPPPQKTHSLLSSLYRAGVPTGVYTTWGQIQNKQSTLQLQRECQRTVVSTRALQE